MLAGTGAELSGKLGLQLPASGLSFEVAARTLLNHGEAIEDWGVSAGLSWAPGATPGRGLSLSFRPQYGATSSRQQEFWQTGGLNYRTGAAGAETPTLSYRLQLEYGLSLLADRANVVLFTRNELRHADDRLSLGFNFNYGESLSAGYEATLGGSGYSNFAPSAYGSLAHSAIGMPGYGSLAQPATGISSSQAAVGNGSQFLQPSRTAPYRAYQPGPHSFGQSPSLPWPGGPPQAAASRTGALTHGFYLRYHKRF